MKPDHHPRLSHDASSACDLATTHTSHPRTARGAANRSRKISQLRGIRDASPLVPPTLLTAHCVASRAVQDWAVEVALPPSLQAAAPLTLTRREFEELSEALFERALKPVRQVQQLGVGTECWLMRGA